ncbi:MAG: peptidylprolyl isomerase [Hellea sp.]
MSKLFREPLVHFIILGALLFAGHMVWQRHVTKADYTITVTTAEMERQALIFAGENRRQPTDDDLKALLFSHVEEQALMREAQRLGLGEDDTIIRRRLAQKMRFIIEDVDAPALPDEARLKAWFSENINQFVSPETRSFSHIYFSPETHGEAIEKSALGALGKLLLQNPPTDWEMQGDPFMLKRQFKDLRAIEATRLFGPEFTKGIFTAPFTGPGESWQGPVESAFGLHLIRIDNVTPKSTPAFNEVRGEVEAAWQEQAQRIANQNNLKDVIKKYKVDVQDPDETSGETPGETSGESEGTARK